MIGMKRDEHDRKSAVAAEELLGAAQVIHFQQPVTSAEGRRADGASDAVVDGVTEYGGRRERHARERRAERAARIHRRECPHCEKQRVARKERRHDQAGLREDHGEEDRVDPQLVPGEQLHQVPVEMQNEVDEPRQHGAGGYGEGSWRAKGVPPWNPRGCRREGKALERAGLADQGSSARSGQQRAIRAAARGQGSSARVRAPARA